MKEIFDSLKEITNTLIKSKFSKQQAITKEDIHSLEEQHRCGVSGDKDGSLIYRKYFGPSDADYFEILSILHWREKYLSLFFRMLYIWLKNTPYEKFLKVDYVSRHTFYERRKKFAESGYLVFSLQSEDELTRIEFSVNAHDIQCKLNNRSPLHLNAWIQSWGEIINNLHSILEGEEHTHVIVDPLFKAMCKKFPEEFILAEHEVESSVYF